MYKVVTGDTFAIISRKVYGSETQSGLIMSANPGVIEPIAPGTELTIPNSPLSQTDRVTPAQATDPDEVAILINGVRFRFWLKYELVVSLDALWAVTFDAPFEPDDPNFRSTFKPFKFSKVEVTIGGVPAFTGVIVNVEPQVETDSKTVRVSCYATPGVLMDCTASPSSYPIEFTNRKLDAIAQTICSPFGINVKFESSPGAAFDSVDLKPSKKLFSFLTSLAKQRGLILTNDASGALIFRKSSASGQPVASLTQGQSPLVSVTPQFNPQEYYSSITGIEPTLVGIPGSKYTSRNSHLSGVLRPLTFEVSDSTQGDVKTAAQAKLGRMFGGMVSYNVRLLTNRDPSGALWKPDTFLNLLAPAAMVYSNYKFIIRIVKFKRQSDVSETELNLVLPGAFSGEVPGKLPWD